MPVEPKEDVDYYTAELRRYTVCIEVEVDASCDDSDDDDSDICIKAVDEFRAGSIDGNATVVFSEKIREVELDFKTDLPFDREEWRQKKLRELGLNENGEPLRAHEKERPESEKTLKDFYPR